MATTGFWPVKSSLKEVIAYAENPDKTTNKKYLDEDLWNVLQYVDNAKKTDEKMFVSAINCNVKRAYEQMMAVKKRYNKTDKNIAYHGFQSFETGEVTPAEAHDIGLETAKKMWGNDYQIVVTTHLNTDNLHNHIVVNSVSFRTGKKFENHVSDHYKLREISDKVCRNYGKSVLENADFYSKSKKEYWLNKNGNLSHREILKRDVEAALKLSHTPEFFENHLKYMGYKFMREGEHLSVKAPDWQRSVRLDSLGYTKEVINKRLAFNREDCNSRMICYKNQPTKPKYTPLLLFEIEFRKTKNMDGIQVVFALIIELFKLITGDNIDKALTKPLSPTLRREVRNLDKILKQYKFLCDNHIDSAKELVSFVEEKKAEIRSFENERNTLYNRIRRPKSVGEKEENKAKARDISAKLKPLRDELNTATAVIERIPKLKKLLETERQMETEIKNINKNRSYER